MADTTDMFDYLRWRGDISMEKTGFLDADALVLSRISYIPFDGIVPSEAGDFITLGDACRFFLSSPDAAARVLSSRDIELLHAVCDSPRFADLGVSGFVNRIDCDAEMQFSAMIYLLYKNTLGVFFRGTDNTIVGWKEDFNMSFSFPVPSQQTALDYLESAAKLTGRLIVGGHSKGGNLAAYSSSLCSESVKKRIERVYNLDGPGFMGRILDASMEETIHTFLPQSSVVGMILGHEEKYTIVHSSGTGIMQHDLYSWQTMRGGFVTLETVSGGGRFADETLRGWLVNMDNAQREKFTDALFSVLEATGADTVRDIGENKLQSAAFMLKSIKDMDEETRRAISRTLSLLFSSVWDSIFTRIPGIFRKTDAEIGNNLTSVKNS